jgi:hypothetical protein
MAFLNSRPLRAVCLLWRNLADQIYLNTQWVFDDSPNWPDPDQRKRRSCPKKLSPGAKKYIRLNRTILVGEGKAPIKIQNSYPISTLSLIIRGDGSTQAPLQSLLDIISFPDHLSALNIQLDCTQVAEGILTEIQTSLTTLTTLRLCLQAHLITEPLELPTVVTLFLSLRGTGMLPKHANFVQWRLPSLRNISLTDERWSPDRWHPNDTDPFFFALLRGHINLIQSLRIEPITKDISDVNSPICWLKMTKLKALAGNFERARIEPKQIYGPQSSLRHLIQTTVYISSEYLSSTRAQVKHFMKGCLRLETVTLSTSCTRNQDMRKVIPRSL